MWTARWHSTRLDRAIGSWKKVGLSRCTRLFRDEALRHADRHAAALPAVFGPQQEFSLSGLMSTLATVADDMAREAVRPPAIVVVGDVVKVANPDRY